MRRRLALARDARRRRRADGRGAARRARRLSAEGGDLRRRDDRAPRFRSTRSSRTSRPPGGSSTRPRRSSTTTRTRRARRERPAAGGRVGVQGHERRQALHVLHPQGLPLQRRHAGHRARTSSTRSTGSRNQDLASPGAQFITDPKGTEIVGAKEVNRGQAHARQRSPGQRKPADHQSDQAGRHVPVEDHDAVLPGDLDEAPARPRDRECRQHHRPAFGRPVRVGRGTSLTS